MKITYSRARWLEIAISAYSLARDLRPNYSMWKDPRSRTRRVRSSHPVFRRSAVSSLQPCYI